MTPALVRPVLRTLISDLTGVAEDHVYWGGRPIGYTGDAWVQLRLASTVRRGHDEVRYDYDATHDVGTPSAFDELIPTQTGIRDAVLQVQCWSYVDTDTTDALSMAMAIQDAIHLDEYRAPLTAVDIAVASVGAPVEIPTTEDDREVSVVALDLQLNAIASTAGTRIGYVEQWGVEGEADMPDGTTATIVNEVMP